MRYRAEDSAGDYQFGLGLVNFLIDTPAAVGQAGQTRLNLFRGEYGPDTTVGMPWDTQVIGYNSAALYDQLIREQILGTTGVTSIIGYSSSLDPLTRELTISCSIATQYGLLADQVFTVPAAAGLSLVQEILFDELVNKSFRSS